MDDDEGRRTGESMLVSVGQRRRRLSGGSRGQKEMRASALQGMSAVGYEESASDDVEE
jgi:hypothetical protein